MVENLSGHTLEVEQNISNQGHAHNSDQAGHTQAGHAQTLVQTAPAPKKSRLSLGRNRNQMPMPTPPAIIPPCKSQFYSLTFQNSPVSINRFLIHVNQI